MNCFDLHQKLKLPCDKRECRQWIEFKQDCNCVLIAIENNGDKSMTLRQVGDRIGVSFVRVKQIEDKILKKLKKKNSDLDS
jgi:hypothetical protein